MLLFYDRGCFIFFRGGGEYKLRLSYDCILAGCEITESLAGYPRLATVFFSHSRFNYYIPWGCFILINYDGTSLTSSGLRGEVLEGAPLC